MSRNAMDACIDQAEERADQRETARREWLESVKPLPCTGLCRDCDTVARCSKFAACPNPKVPA